MFELAKLAGYLFSPLTLALGLWLLSATALLFRRRRLATALAAIAFAGLWVASTPVTGQTLAASLESRYPPRTVKETPAGDAILVLGGALVGAHPPRRPTFNLGGAATRVWHAAELYRAGKARWIVVAAGNQPGSRGQQVEADAIADMLQVLGVPRSAVVLEGRSRNTRENAANVRAVIQRLGARRVLLVTSGVHMPRAMKTFALEWAGSGVTFYPAPADIAVASPVFSADMWIPNASALGFVTGALKEYAGIVALDIIG
jgi:uncharacterized SAM-binding protein YcdF (DUF218 family)